MLQRGEIVGVAAAIGQLDVEVARLLAEGKVLLAMQRQREHARVVLEDARGAVALVHVEIDHGHRQPPPVAGVFRLHEPGRHGSVVEDAEAAALAGVGVVRATRHVGRHALRKGHAAGGDGGPGGSARALDHRLAPGKADLAHRLWADAAFADGGDPFGRVGERQLVVAGTRGHVHPHGRKLLQQAVAQHRVARHGKAMALGQGQDELAGIEGAHGRILERQAEFRRRVLNCCRAAKTPCPQKSAAYT